MIDKSLTINGLTTTPGITVSGNNVVRVFDVSAGTVIINNLTIQNGRSAPTLSANLGGAGLFVDNSGTTVTLSNCAVLDNIANLAATRGGGIVVNTGANLTMNNCTVSGNSANSDGGGILNLGNLTVNNATIVNNTTPGSGGGLETDAGMTTLRNTIIAGNSGASGEDCYTPSGTTQSAGYTLVSSANNCGISAGTGDVTGFSYASLMLGSLQNNGGPTSTYALLAGRPAVDAIPGCNGAPAVDQRLQPRPGDTACDAGAYEKSLGYREYHEVSSTTMTAFGPTLVGIRRDSGFTDPEVITVTKMTTWKIAPTNSIYVWWEITPTVTSGISLTLQLCYSDAEAKGQIPTALSFWRKEGGVWSQVGGTPTLTTDGSGNHCATLSGLTTFSIWTLATDQPTGVELLRFGVRSARVPGWGWVMFWAGAFGITVITLIRSRRRLT